jgi:magnesium transporter
MDKIVATPTETIASTDIAASLSGERAADMVEALNALPPATAAEVLLHLPLERAVEVLDLPGLDYDAEIVQNLPVERAVAFLSGMAADRVADVFRRMAEPARSGVLGRLDRETQDSLRRLLSYPEHSAGSIMTTEFVSVPADWTIEQTLDHIRRVEHTRETVYAVYVLDPVRKTLLQSATLRRLISGDPKSSILSIAMPRRPITVSPLADREEAARLISKYDLLAVPVVDKAGHVLGIVTVDDVIDAIIQESAEDVQRFGGMAALNEPYLRIGFGQMIRKRAGWLSALFISEMLTASAMQFFEGELEKAIVLTLFIPLIMSSGGNSGSQATSLLIRALALGQLRLRDWWRVALRELPTGLALGAILGLIGVVRIIVWQRFGFYNYGAHWLLIATMLQQLWWGSSPSAPLPDPCCRSFCSGWASIPPAPRPPSSPLWWM